MVSSSKQPADPRAKGPTQAGSAKKKKMRWGDRQKGWGSAEEAEASEWRMEGQTVWDLAAWGVEGRG